MDISPFYAPTDTPKGSVLLVHGFGEHSGRYERMRAALAKAGYDTWARDFTGHGKNPDGPRARVDVGALIGETVKAMSQHAQVARSENLFVFGHSMGGLAALAGTLLYPTGLVACAVTGPAVRPLPHVPALAARAAAAVARVVPALGSVKLDDNLLSRDPKVIEEYRADPLVYQGTVPLLTGATMAVQGDQVIRNAAMLAVPTLLLHGTDDGLASVNGSEEFAAAAGDLAVFEPAEGAFHELLNEPEHEIYESRIIDWFNQWLPAI